MPLVFTAGCDRHKQSPGGAPDEADTLSETDATRQDSIPLTDGIPGDPGVLAAIEISSTPGKDVGRGRVLARSRSGTWVVYWQTKSNKPQEGCVVACRKGCDQKLEIRGIGSHVVDAQFAGPDVVLLTVRRVADTPDDILSKGNRRSIAIDLRRQKVLYALPILQAERE